MILAIDPGNKQSGYAILDTDYKPVDFGKIDNTTLKSIIRQAVWSKRVDRVVIEMVASYGMPVGETVFDTCVWIGRFTELIAQCPTQDTEITYVKRKEYIVDLIGSVKAKDSNVIQYLIDRFAKDTPNRGKGTKDNEGWFHGFKADVWQAYAIAVWALDKEKKDGHDRI